MTEPVKRTAVRRASTGFFVLGVPPKLCAGLLKSSCCPTPITAGTVAIVVGFPPATWSYNLSPASRGAFFIRCCAASNFTACALRPHGRQGSMKRRTGIVRANINPALPRNRIRPVASVGHFAERTPGEHLHGGFPSHPIDCRTAPSVSRSRPAASSGPRAGRTERTRQQPKTRGRWHGIRNPRVAWP
jgi:hypothetical protein